MLSIRGLVKVYPGPVAALQRVDLDVPVGMFGLLGPNGAGKSTLMRVLAGLLEPTSGSVHLDGEDVLADPALVRRTLGYLPQDFGFYPHLTGEQMLRHLLVLKGVSAPRGLKSLVTELLERVNLTFAARRAVKSYSGGMRQRLGIAQAIAGDPSLVIVDEPTAGLDPEERNRFNNLLAEIGESKVVILSTHIVDDVTDLCSRMAILVDGRVVSAGTPAALIAGLDGKVWTRAVEPGELPALRSQFELIATRLRGGRTVIHVLADAAPDPRFEPVAAGLAKVYFSTLHAQRKARGPVASEAAAIARAA